MKRLIIFFVLGFILINPVFAQEIKEKPELPENYQKWPLYLTDSMEINEQTTASIEIWANQTKSINNSAPIKVVTITLINSEIIFSTYIEASENNSSGVTTSSMLIDGKYYIYNIKPKSIPPKIREKWTNNLMNKFNLSNKDILPLISFINWFIESIVR